MKPIILFVGSLAAIVGRAQSPSQTSAQAQATLIVLPYLAVQFSSTSPISFLITDAGKAGSYAQSAQFTVYSNIGYRVITFLNAPTTATGVPAPGSFAATTNLLGVQPPTGGQTGTLTVSITGLTISNTPIGDYSTGGAAVVQVVQSG
jgi:hypothetical protein